MKLGFVGVGKIATSVIEGIFKAKINIKEIILSPKNNKNSKSLKKKFKKIKILGAKFPKHDLWIRFFYICAGNFAPKIFGTDLWIRAL